VELYLSGTSHALPCCFLLEPGNRGSLKILEDKDIGEEKVNEGELAFFIFVVVARLLRVTVGRMRDAIEQATFFVILFALAAQIGAVEPQGHFDPLCFRKVGGEVCFNKVRAAAIKHSRVPMMASIGAVAPPLLNLLGFDWPDATGTFGALAVKRVKVEFLELFVVSGMMELRLRDQGREPGNFGDPVGFDMYNEDMRNKEINNGRMAMISILGIFAAEFETGKNAIEHLTLFATLFDPVAQIGAEFCDEVGPNKLRAAAVECGRGPMMASIGAVAPPLLTLQGFDCPDATGTFGALAVTRANLGFLELFVVSGMIELKRKDQHREPGNFGDPIGFDLCCDDMQSSFTSSSTSSSSSGFSTSTECRLVS